MSQIGVVYTTVATHEQAAQLAKEAVILGLAACVHHSSITSVYLWKGQLENAEEYTLRFKTAQEGVPALISWIQSHHPYEVPALWWQVVETSEAYALYLSEPRP